MNQPSSVREDPQSVPQVLTSDKLGATLRSGHAPVLETKGSRQTRNWSSVLRSQTPSAASAASMCRRVDHSKTPMRLEEVRESPEGCVEPVLLGSVVA